MRRAALLLCLSAVGGCVFGDCTFSTSAVDMVSCTHAFTPNKPMLTFVLVIANSTGRVIRVIVFSNAHESRALGEADVVMLAPRVSAKPTVNDITIQTTQQR